MTYKCKDIQTEKYRQREEKNTMIQLSFFSDASSTKYLQIDFIHYA